MIVDADHSQFIIASIYLISKSVFPMGVILNYVPGFNVAWGLELSISSSYSFMTKLN